MKKHRLLFVDDEQKILKSLERLFLEEGYEIALASSGEDALEKMETDKPALVISDQRMPGMQGVELLTRIRESSPDTIGVLLTGHTDIKAAIGAINSGAVYKYIEKPWNDEDLKITIRRALEQYDLVKKNWRLTEIVKEQNKELRFLNKNLENRVQEKTDEIQQKNVQLEGLNEQLKKSFVDVVRVLSGLIEMRDEYIGGHTKRVAAASKEVAVTFGLSEEEVFEIEVAALLHDIGKIGLRDETLASSSLKPDGEHSKLQEQHVVMGQMSLVGIDGLHRVAAIIRHHHERYDGTGVPDKLKGEQIPLGSRIIAVVDMFDGLRFRRKPQKSFTEDLACASLTKGSATRFDPEIIEKFMDFLQGLRHKYSGKKYVKTTLGGLRDNMVLAHDIITKDNMLLVANGERMKQSYLEKIHYYVKRGQIDDRFYVYPSEEAKKPVPGSQQSG